MKNFSTKKIVTVLAIALFPAAVFAQSGTLSPTELVKQMQGLLNQYSERIRVLEAENQLLRNIMAKNEIQIPLEEYSKILNSTGTISAAPTLNSATNTNTTTTQPTIITSSLSTIQKGFIDQINKDWEGIRGAYGFPADARIGGYEFVKNESGDDVFVDIIFGNGTPEGAYNAKILYQFDKITFKRKLVGLFIYNSETKGYVTKTGTNPFPGAERDIIRGTLTGATTTVSSVATKPTTTNQVPTAPKAADSDAAVAMENKLLSLYQARNYSWVLSTSDAYLKTSAPTYKIIQLRYRSLFLVREFNQALAEVQKMEKAGLATQFSYCEGYAIAVNAGNQELATKYKKLAGSGCSTAGS